MKVIKDIRKFTKAFIAGENDIVYIKKSHKRDSWIAPYTLNPIRLLIHSNRHYHWYITLLIDPKKRVFNDIDYRYDYKRYSIILEREGYRAEKHLCNLCPDKPNCTAYLKRILHPKTPARCSPESKGIFNTLGHINEVYDKSIKEWLKNLYRDMRTQKVI